MKDAATAGASRNAGFGNGSQSAGILEDGRKVTLQLVRELTQEELECIRRERGEQRFQNSHFPGTRRVSLTNWCQ